MKKILPVLAVFAALFVLAGCCGGKQKCHKQHQHTALCVDEDCSEEKKDNASGGNKTAMEENSQQKDTEKGNTPVDKKQLSSR
jgi:hypothetical protein